MFLIHRSDIESLSSALVYEEIELSNAKLELKEPKKMLSESRDKLDDSENTIVKLSNKR